MLRYFIAGNIWAFLAVLLVLGRKAWRAGPTRYTFFGAGSMSASEYNLLIVCGIAAAVIFFIMAWKTRKKT